MTEKKFNFGEYYKNNPEFRARHLEKQRAKVECECGITVTKSHLGEHKKTKRHMQKLNLEKDERDEIKLLHQRIQRLEKRLEQDDDD